MSRCVRTLLALAIFVAAVALVVSARTHLKHGPPAVLDVDGHEPRPETNATGDGAETPRQLQANDKALKSAKNPPQMPRRMSPLVDFHIPTSSLKTSW